MSGRVKKTPARESTTTIPAMSPEGGSTIISGSITAAAPEETGIRSRALSPGDLESLIRLLGVSGRRLIECDGEWRVLPRGHRRRRSLMNVSAEDVERLKAEKLLVASVNGYVLAPDHRTTPEAAPAAGPWIFKAACAPGAKGTWRGFARLAELARLGRGPLSLRQALAGLRFIEDTEAAACDPLLTMSWDAVPADRNTRSGRSGGLQHHARRAAQRIERIREALGKQDFTIVHAACVERVNLKALERRFGLKRLGARTVLPQVLEKVAEVYDG